jgi:hypothetical protein
MIVTRHKPRNGYNNCKDTNKEEAMIFTYKDISREQAFIITRHIQIKGFDAYQDTVCLNAKFKNKHTVATPTYGLFLT